MRYLSSICLMMIVSVVAHSAEVDCSEAYGGQPAKCEVVKCDSKYISFIGKWSGPFSSYVRELSAPKTSVFRPFQNEVTYSEADCLKSSATGDTFIIGRRVDKYPAFQSLPAKTVEGLLITGKRTDGSPFLKTVDDEGVNEYSLAYQNKVANMSVWNLIIPANGSNPEMRFTTIDGQDFSETSLHKRNVTVTMSVGPADAPYWEGIVSSGYHILKK